MSKKQLLLLAASLSAMPVLAIFFTPKQSESCGPDFPESVFVNMTTPDAPLDSFAAGKIGIVRSYARSYLTVAYRHLSGHPLTKSEQEDAVALWESRLNNYSVKSYSSFDSSLPDWDSISNEILPPFTNPDSTALENTMYRRTSYDDYSYYRSITPSAVQNATRRLLELVRSHGRQSDEVKDWITTQRIVWSSDGAVTLPEYSGPNSTIKTDREYQRAAAHFYAGSYDTARMLFERIAENPTSPWQKEGLYLAARAMARKGSLEDSVGNSGFTLAESLIIRIKDPSLAKQKLYLMDYVHGWIDPERQALELSKRLQDNDPAHFEHELDDYTKMLDRVLGNPQSYEAHGDPIYSVPESLAKDDMTDWIMTFGSQDSTDAAHAMERWLATKSTPWLIAALSTAKSMHVSFFTKIDASSPAYESYVFYLGKLLHKEDDTEILRPMLDGALALPITASARNDFMRMRQDIASDMTDLLRMISRRPLGTAYGSDMAGPTRSDSTLEIDYDENALRVLNRSLPLTRIIEAVDLDHIKGEPGLRLLRSAWSRAVLLGREDDAMRLAYKLESDPTLGPWMKKYRAAKPGEARHRVAVFIHLKHPGLTPLVHLAPPRYASIADMDSYRDNGWGTLYTDDLPKEEYYYDEGALRPVSLPFLTSEERAQMEREWKQLALASPSPNYLISEAIKWAKAAPKDADVPEALHLAVHLSRYGRNDEKTGSFSKQAHTILQRKYGKTKFAKATPYWFE
jgi:hypothetical protein